MGFKDIICPVSCAHKAQIVKSCFGGTISSGDSASVLRKNKEVFLFLDKDADVSVAVLKRKAISTLSKSIDPYLKGKRNLGPEYYHASFPLLTVHLYCDIVVRTA